MKRTIRSLSLMSAALAMSCAAAASAAPIVIDGFGGSLNPAYVQASAFTGSNTAVITYDTTTNPGSLTYSFANASSSSQAVQTDLLRDDYKLLTDGDWVQIKTTINVTSAGTSNPTRLYGGVAVGLKGDATRDNIAAVYVRSDGSVGAQYYNGTTVVVDTLVAASPSPLFPTISGPGTSIPVWTRLTRASATSLIPSYSTDGTIFTSGAAIPIVNLSGLGIGVYNGNATTSRTGTVLYDDLTVDIVPEPTALFIGSIGSVGIVFLAGLRKRK